jgi:hypothetical protein
MAADESTAGGRPAREPSLAVFIGLVVLSACAAVFADDNPDLWFHLAAGRSIWEHGLPRQETWTLAAAGSRPWLSEWLYQVPIYGLHQAGGFAALAAVRMASAAAATALAVALARTLGGAGWGFALAIPLALAVARARMIARPESLGIVLVLLFCVVLERARQGESDRRWALIPLQALWANLHSSWVFGLAAAALYSVDAWFRRSPERSGPGDLQPRAGPASALLLVLALLGASALAPDPLWTLSHPFRFLGEAARDPLTASIEELRAWSWNADARDPFTAWLALAALGVALGGAAAWRASPPLCLAALGALALGWAGFRFRALAALLPLAPLGMALGGGGARGAVASLLAFLALGAGSAWLVLAPQYRIGLEPPEDSYPGRAVALADSLGLEGAILNSFHHGGYLLWARGESRPPLLDGRGLGPPEFRALYARAMGSSAALDTLIEQWIFTHAILAPPRHPGDRMAGALAARRDWALVFADDGGLLFVRRDLHPQAARALAYRWFTPDYDTMAVRCARALDQERLLAALVGELERARRESPQHARASLWLGLLHLALGDAPRARELLEETHRLAPATPGLSLRLALAREQTGDAAGARAAYRRALQEPDDAAVARAALARLR